MRMYFHLEYDDVILFKTWLPESATAYACALMVTFLLAVVSAWLRALRVLHEARPPRQAASAPPRIRDVLRGNAGRAALVVAGSSADYLLMLVAMTFNVGLFFAIVIGLGTGTLIFGHWGRSCSTPHELANPFLFPRQPDMMESPCH